MRDAFGLTALACLILAATVRAEDGAEVAPGQLPHAVKDAVEQNLPGAELLHAHKEIEAGKECYTVSVNDRGRVSYYYVSPNGHILTARREPFSLSRLPDLWIAVVLVAVIAGVMPGAISRRLAQAARDRRISIAREWLSTWLGASFVICILLSQLSTVPREKDWLVLLPFCFLCGAVTASLVEALGLTVQSLRGYRPGVSPLDYRSLHRGSRAAVAFNPARDAPHRT